MPASFPTITGPAWAKSLTEARIRRAEQAARIRQQVSKIQLPKK